MSVALISVEFMFIGTATAGRTPAKQFQRPIQTQCKLAFDAFYDLFPGALKKRLKTVSQSTLEQWVLVPGEFAVVPNRSPKAPRTADNNDYNQRTNTANSLHSKSVPNPLQIL